MARNRFFEQKGTQALPAFESCEFAGTVRAAKLLTSGDMELTLHIPMSEKYNAMTLTDAVGIMVLFHAERRRRSQARLMLVPEQENE